MLCTLSTLTCAAGAGGRQSDNAPEGQESPRSNAQASAALPSQILGIRDTHLHIRIKSILLRSRALGALRIVLARTVHNGQSCARTPRMPLRDTMCARCHCIGTDQPSTHRWAMAGLAAGELHRVPLKDGLANHNAFWSYKSNQYETVEWCVVVVAVACCIRGEMTRHLLSTRSI